VDTLVIITALALPMLLGTSLMNLVVPLRTEGRGALTAGSGILAGLITLPLLIRLVNAAGLGLNFAVTAILCIAVTAVAFLYWLKRRKSDPVLFSLPAETADLSRSEILLFAVFIALAAWHLLVPTLELIARPLYAWDTTMHWATKAKAWFGRGELTPFVPPQAWLNIGGEGVLTDTNASYPATVPLLQVWMCLAIGRWDESIMNLPWAMCFLGLGLAFYGMARAASVKPVIAALFTYFLMSLPLMNIHVALAGYADIFVTGTFTVAALAFYLWSVDRQRWQAGIAFAFAFSGPLVKVEGLLWLATFIPAIAIVLLRWQLSLLFLGFTCGAVALLLVFLPQDVALAGHSLESLLIFYRPRATEQLIASFWYYGNWNLLAYLVAALPLLVIAINPSDRYQLRGLLALMVSVVAIFVFLFIYTRFAAGAIRLTGVSRVAMHFVPAMLFLLMLLVNSKIHASPDEGLDKLTSPDRENPDT